MVLHWLDTASVPLLGAVCAHGALWSMRVMMADADGRRAIIRSSFGLIKLCQFYFLLFLAAVRYTLVLEHNCDPALRPNCCSATHPTPRTCSVSVAVEREETGTLYYGEAPMQLNALGAV